MDDLKSETVDSLIRERAKKNTDKIFVRFKEESLTYSKIDNISNQMANGLLNMGVEEGDHIGLFMENSLEYICMIFAIAKVGSVMVPLNASLRGDDLQYHIKDSDPTVVFVDAKLENAFTDAEIDMKNIIIVNDNNGQLPQEFIDLPTKAVNKEVKPSDPFSIIYTSGTTGMPKGVMLPHRSYITTPVEYSKNIGVKTGDIWYTPLPLFHVNAQQTTLMGSMVNNISMVLERKFSASKFWDRVNKHNATIFNYIGGMISILHKQDEEPSENSLRVGTGGGAPSEMRKTFENKHDLKLLEGFGLTETGTSSIKVRYDMPADIRHETVGKPVSYASVAIVDENDKKLPPYTNGEIVVRPEEPYCMMLEYYNNPNETLNTWRNLWIHTGDIGYTDENGYVYFVDRMKFRIRRRGENISSYEVEEIISQHSSVKETAVVGVDSGLGDEEVKAYIIGSVDPENIIEFCDGRLAEFKIPRYIEMVDKLPKTETERIQKKELADRGVNAAWDRREEH